jgi:hypothetical protein
MNLLALKGEVSCKRCIVQEVRSVRKLLTVGSTTIFLLVLPILTALKLPRRKAGSWVLDPTANKKIESGMKTQWKLYKVEK